MRRVLSVWQKDKMKDGSREGEKLWVKRCLPYFPYPTLLCLGMRQKITWRNYMLIFWVNEGTALGSAQCHVPTLLTALYSRRLPVKLYPLTTLTNRHTIRNIPRQTNSSLTLMLHYQGNVQNK